MPLPEGASAGLGSVLDRLASSLYDARTSEGRVVVYNPASIEARGVVHTIAFSTEAGLKSPGGFYEDSFTPTVSRD